MRHQDEEEELNEEEEKMEKWRVKGIRKRGRQ